MPIGSGISGQIGVAPEVTPGVAVAASRFYEFDSETLGKKKGIVQGMGLHAGGQYARAGRRAYTTRDIDGGFVMDVPTKGAGLLLSNMLGAPGTIAQQGVTAAWLQTHVPGALTGRTLTVQKGVPQTDGTVRAFTYNGTKISSWEVNCSIGGIPKLHLGLDAWDENPTGAGAFALQAAAYPVGTGVFNFSQGTITLGGTATTTAGVTSIAGGTVAANIKAFSLKGANPMKTDRFFFGSAGIKAEQIENGYRTLTGSLDTEFVNQATIYDVFAADGAAAFEIKFVGPQIGTTGFYQTFDIVVPNIHYDTSRVPLGGPDIVHVQAPFTVLDDQTNNVVQIQYTSTDTAI